MIALTDISGFLSGRIWLYSQANSSLNLAIKEIEDQLSSDIGLINSISSYIINSGGKRLRPLLEECLPYFEKIITYSL